MSNPLDQMLDFLTTGSNWTGADGIAHRIAEHLQLTGESVGIACAVALPLALVLGHYGRGAFVAINASNAGRAVPTLAVLTLLALWEPVGIGDRAAVTALILFAVPPILTNAYVGVRGVDPDVKEAARGMGMSNRQVLMRVELPLALPLIIAGIRTAVVQVIATATLAAVVASGGLGRLIYDGDSTQNTGEYLAGAFVVVALAATAEIALGTVERWLSRRAGVASTRRRVEKTDRDAVPA